MAGQMSMNGVHLCILWDAYNKCVWVVSSNHCVYLGRGGVFSNVGGVCVTALDQLM